MDIFNLWTVVVVAVAGHYFLEYKKLEKANVQGLKELEERVEKLEKPDKG